MEENSKSNELILTYISNAQEIKNLAKFIRTKYDRPTGAIYDEVCAEFKCTAERDENNNHHIFTFSSERDKIYFMLHT